MARSIIEVSNVSKRYRLGSIGAATLRESVSNWFASKLARERAQEKKDFWALRDVNFEVAPGEVMGLLGRNGSGKSTMLKILSRITEPTTGRVVLRGKIASLLEVGTGFHPDLTGRENVFLNGALLGMTRAEVRRKFDEIVAFSEVETFIDTPVKRYSSGMYVRLAFAVAAHLEPEILIVDEVLAVGDAAFQQKCLGKMQNVAEKEGRTVLFVSHNMQAVTALCTKAILLQHGKVMGVGAPAAIVAQYLDSLGSGGSGDHWTGRLGDNSLTVTSARLVGARNGFLHNHEPVVIEIQATVHKPILGLVFGLEVWTQQEQLLAYSAYDDRSAPPATTVPPGPFGWRLTIPANSLSSGNYEFRLDVCVHSIRRIVPANEIRLSARIENIAGIARRFHTERNELFRPDWRWEQIAAPTGPSHAD